MSGKTIFSGGQICQWGGGYFLIFFWWQSGDSHAISQLLTVAFCNMSTVDILTVYLLTVYFSSSPSFESKNRQKKSNSLLFQKSIKFKSPHLVTNLSLNYPINIRDDHHHCSALGLHLIIDYDWMYSETDFRTMKDTIFFIDILLLKNFEISHKSKPLSLHR